MAASPVPGIIVLALGAGALGFPDALRDLFQIAGRSPLTDIAICVLAMSAVTAQALGFMLLARFLRKAARVGGGDDAHAPGMPRRTDRFAQVTLVVSLGVAFLVSACLLVASGAGGLLHLVAADVARKMKSPVVAAAVATGAAAVLLPCARSLLRVFRRDEDRSDGATAAAAASRSTGAGRFDNVIQVASFTGAAAFVLLLAVPGGLYYIQRGSLVDVSVAVAVAAVVGTNVLLLARFAFTRKARAGGRAAPTPAAETRRVGGELTRLVPYLYLAVISFAALICCLVVTTHAPLQSEADGAKYP